MPQGVGQYEVIRKIAAGGMAELHLARRHDDELVAIKQILPQFANDPAFIAMFLDEARIAATLDHPNVVKMHEVGSDGKTYFIVMEFLDGENLRALMKQLKSLGRPFGLEQAINILIGIAAGLHYAHEKVGPDGRPLQIVHRDVSPQNALITHAGDVKVVDFGIAKAANRASETRAGQLKGKLAYMSPEQVSGEALDRRSDVYALGALMYELTVGRRLIKNNPDYVMMKQITEGDIAAPTQFLPLYPEDLEAILLKALAKRRGQRYQTMLAFQEDLEAFAARHHLTLGPPSLARMMREAFGSNATLPPPDDEDVVEPAPEAPVRAKPIAVTWAPAAPIAPTAGLTIDQRRVGAVLVVSLRGRLTESFAGAALGKQLAGEVILDVSGIERITSFGVREWLAMMNAAPSTLTHLYLSRCTESVVNQLTMVRGFAGPGRVVSFYAPYVCSACAHPFHRLIDAEADANAVRRLQPPAATCDRCGQDGRFDDDPRSYFAIAPQLATTVPSHIRAATGPVEPIGRPSLEKHLEGNTTRIAVNGPLSPTLRWKQSTEGLEGDVILDLQGVTDLPPAGIGPLVLAWTRIRSDLTTLTIEGCPLPLMVPLQPLADVQSVQIQGQCATCGTPKRGVYPRSHAEQWVKTGGVFPCPGCQGPLTVAAETQAVAVSLWGRPSEVDSGVEALAERLDGPGGVADSPRSGSLATLAAAIGIVAALFLIFTAAVLITLWAR